MTLLAPHAERLLPDRLVDPASYRMTAAPPYDAQPAWGLPAATEKRIASGSKPSSSSSSSAAIAAAATAAAAAAVAAAPSMYSSHHAAAAASYASHARSATAASWQAEGSNSLGESSRLPARPSSSSSVMAGGSSTKRKSSFSHDAAPAAASPPAASPTPKKRQKQKHSSKQSLEQVSTWFSQMLCYIWFSDGNLDSTRPSTPVRSPMTSYSPLHSSPLAERHRHLAGMGHPTHGRHRSASSAMEAQGMATAPLELQTTDAPTSPPISESGDTTQLRLAPRSKFVRFVKAVLSTTQLSNSVIILALLFIYRLKSAHRRLRGQQGSEFRLAVAGLMLANKMLDDHTFTNQTWSEITHMPLKELGQMEVEFWLGLKMKLHVDESEYFAWLRTLEQLADQRNASITKREREITLRKSMVAAHQQALAASMRAPGRRLGSFGTMSPPLTEPRSSYFGSGASGIEPHHGGYPHAMPSAHMLPLSPLSAPSSASEAAERSQSAGPFAWSVPESSPFAFQCPPAPATEPRLSPNSPQRSRQPLHVIDQVQHRDAERRSGQWPAMPWPESTLDGQVPATAPCTESSLSPASARSLRHRRGLEHSTAANDLSGYSISPRSSHGRFARRSPFDEAQYRVEQQQQQSHARAAAAAAAEHDQRLAQQRDAATAAVYRSIFANALTPTTLVASYSAFPSEGQLTMPPVPLSYHSLASDSGNPFGILGVTLPPLQHTPTPHGHLTPTHGVVSSGPLLHNGSPSGVIHGGSAPSSRPSSYAGRPLSMQHAHPQQLHQPQHHAQHPHHHQLRSHQSSGVAPWPFNNDFQDWPLSNW